MNDTQTNNRVGASHPVYKKLQELPVLDTAHHTGSKQVFSTGRKDLTRITQVAFGRLLPGEAIPPHAHPDMDECFYITAGKGEIKIDGSAYLLEAGIYVEVSAGSMHELYCSEPELEFFYFGLQLYSFAESNSKPGETDNSAASAYTHKQIKP